jgi:alpha-tubulin suppressor-like RCC1 family protein
MLANKTDGTLWSWGQNTSGQLGIGNLTNYSSPKQVGALTTWSTFAGGSAFTLANKTDGTLWSWGLNTDGQLGLGNTTTYSSPKQIGSGTSWLTGIACGFQHAVVTNGQ